MVSDFIEIKIDFSLADSELHDYTCIDNELIINIKSWQNKLIRIVFFEPILFIDRFYGGTVKFGKKTKETDLFTEALKDNYTEVPEDHPYKLFQFLDLYDQPSLEIVSIKYRINDDAYFI